MRVIRWIASLFRSAGEPLPTDPRGAWRYARSTGRALGELLKGANADRGKRMSAAIETQLAGLATARTTRRAMRALRRLARLRGAAKIWSDRARRHAEAATRRRNALTKDVGKTIDLFATSFLVYLLVYGGVVTLLELTGMLTSLTMFESLLGDLRQPMAFAAGAILMLAGHVAGKLLHEASTTERHTRAFVAAALAVATLTLFAIVEMGVGRDANLAARADNKQADQLRSEANSLDSRSRQLEQPSFGDRNQARAPTADRREAERLRGQADAQRRRANRLNDRANEDRTLFFFLAVQLLGFGVGAVGGYLYTATAPIRRNRTLNRIARLHDLRASRCAGRATAFDSKADDHVARVRRIAVEECAWAETSYGHYLKHLSVESGRVQQPAKLALDPASIVADLTAGTDPRAHVVEEGSADSRVASTKKQGKTGKARRGASHNGDDPAKKARRRKG